MNIGTSIRKIGYEDILGAPNAQALLDEYGAESSIPLIGEINQQPKIYAGLEQLGGLTCFGVYAGDMLVGFGVVLITTLPHYGKQVATVESLFVASAHRTGGTGRALMLAVEEYSTQAGCVAILYSAPAQSQFDKLLSASAAYQWTNTVYCRKLL